MITSTATEQCTDETISEPARLFAEERRWSDGRSRAVAALVEARGTTGATLLDAGEGALREQAMELAQLRAEIEASDAAIVEARRRRVQAILASWRGEAEGLRREAEKLLAEAGDRQKKTDRMLDALEKWEDCPYEPRHPDRPAISEGVTGGASMIIHVPTPRTERIRNQAADLEQRAAQLEARKVTMQASIETQDRDELLLLASSWDPMKIAPILAAVEIWLEEAEAPVLERRSRFVGSSVLYCAACGLLIPCAGELDGIVGHGVSLHYTLAWTDGEIDTSRSRVTIPVLDA